MRRIGWLFFVGVTAWVMTVSVSVAQEPVQAPVEDWEPPMALEEEPEYSFGVVKSASESELVISEFDYDSGADKGVAYVLNPETEWENVSSPSEVKEGDEVDIDYLVKEGKKVAVLVAVAKPLDEDLEIESAPVQR